ncbi:hypothetical protein [Corynebacterium sp. AOP12-C2-36]|uniref:hypothetical protein n=1 Tax=Corynebacterium sp. AOP12-C2-36 TaxID=3457723 RepID=UPI004033196B
MSTIARYLGLAIVAALILAGGPSAWVIAALVAALGFNVVPDVLRRRGRQEASQA